MPIFFAHSLIFFMYLGLVSARSAPVLAAASNNLPVLK